MGEKGLETGVGAGAPQTAGLAPGLMGGGGDTGGSGISQLQPSDGGSGISQLQPSDGGSGISQLQPSDGGSGEPFNDLNDVNQ